MKLDPHLYDLVVRSYIENRPSLVEPAPSVDVLRPEAVNDRDVVDYANGSEDNMRGTGEGSVRVHKLPEST